MTSTKIRLQGCRRLPRHFSTGLHPTEPITRAQNQKRQSCARGAQLAQHTPVFRFFEYFEQHTTPPHRRQPRYPFVSLKIRVCGSERPCEITKGTAQGTRNFWYVQWLISPQGAGYLSLPPPAINFVREKLTPVTELNRVVTVAAASTAQSCHAQAHTTLLTLIPS